MLLLKPRHQVMIEQAAIGLPTEKQSAFFDRVTGCSGSNFLLPAA